MIKKMLLAAAGVFCFFAHGAEVLTRVVPINPAEAVFAPFWDTRLAEQEQWKVLAGRLRQDWHNVAVTWNKSDIKPGKAAFEMVRSEKFPCAGYDAMIFSCLIPMDAKLQIEVETDKGTFRKDWIGKSRKRGEYVLSIGDASSEVRRISFRIFDTGKNKTRSGWLSWGGLQNTKYLEMVKRQVRQFAAQPLTRFLAPKGTVPKFRGTINMLMPAAELQHLQEQYVKETKEKGAPPFRIKDFRAYQPEKGLRMSLPFANPHFFGREADDDQKIHTLGDWFLYALIAKDQVLLDKIIRSAIVIALTPNWDCSFIMQFPDSGWDQRAFSHSGAARSLALVLDYASDMLSPAGINLLTRRIAVAGLGEINHNIWKHTYLFRSNQLAVFTRGRIASYLALEKYYRNFRIRPYTDLAMKELFDSIALLVHEDGSYMEGPAYFLYTMTNVRPALEMYANARKIPLHKILPERLQNLGKFGDAFASTDRRGGLIPVSSGQGANRGVGVENALFLAKLAPGSQWVNIYLKQSNSTSASLLSFMERATGKKSLKYVKPAPMAELKKMGIMASTRYFKGEPVKMLIVGTKAKTYCHRHNDRGSFVLEYAGDTYAADPGGQIYADSDSGMVKRSDYHNMLVPADMPDNEPMFVAKADVYPKGKGDETSFSMEILPAPSSYNYFKHWKRNIDSPTPDRFAIRDEYELTGKHKAVRFLWITELPWKKVKDGVIRVEGRDSYALIHYPEELKFTADDLIVRRKETYHRLNFEKAGTKGTLEIKVELYKK